MRQVRLWFTMSQKLVGLQIVFKTPVIKRYIEVYDYERVLILFRLPQGPIYRRSSVNDDFAPWSCHTCLEASPPPQTASHPWLSGPLESEENKVYNEIQHKDIAAFKRATLIIP